MERPQGAKTQMNKIGEVRGTGKGKKRTSETDVQEVDLGGNKQI